MLLTYVGVESRHLLISQKFPQNIIKLFPHCVILYWRHNIFRKEEEKHTKLTVLKRLLYLLIFKLNYDWDRLFEHIVICNHCTLLMKSSIAAYYDKWELRNNKNFFYCFAIIWVPSDYRTNHNTSIVSWELGTHCLITLVIVVFVSLVGSSHYFPFGYLTKNIRLFYEYIMPLYYKGKTVTKFSSNMNFLIIFLGIC